jgi:hypothetical protein
MLGKPILPDGDPLYFLKVPKPSLGGNYPFPSATWEREKTKKGGHTPNS